MAKIGIDNKFFSGIFNQILIKLILIVVIGYVENSESDPNTTPVKFLWKTCGNVYVFCGNVVETLWIQLKWGGSQTIRTML